MHTAEEPYVRKIWKLPEYRGLAAINRTGFVAPPTVVDSVVTELRRMLLSGELRPGERLVEERLTEHLGVSRPPLREALRVLQRDGVVTYMPRRGVTVTPLVPQDVREIYSLRWSLERLAVDLSLPIDTEERLAPLQEALQEMRVAAEANDGAGVAHANWEFHLGLCSMPGHRRLVASYQRLMMQLQICMAMNLRLREQLYGDALESVVRHEALLEAIRSGEREQVHEELDHHGDLTFMEQLDTLMEEGDL
ncbi:MAG: GntR family transcriptional regulator [Actinomycetota bacterium]|jgi:DNA-binding GntR family transcriptional regulator|nr:GntR family transcriptional regulator [Actinomycetota bacterium]